MSMDKIANLQLETTAQYQSLSKLNVQFWNQDRETAILQFQITRNNYPLALSEENVKVFIALESGDSFLVDDKLNFEDQLNGIVSYDIPTDFMKVAAEVKGQVYVTTIDEEEVVVQRQFTFSVANDLIATLPAEDKIREIRYFADMRAEVAEMMTKLNNDFENMNDYVTQVQDTTKEGIASLTKLINDKEKIYNDNHVDKMKELDDKGFEYSQKFDADKQYMDDKFAEFKDAVSESGLITSGEAENWQKYKLTQDTGNAIQVSLGNDLTKLRALSPGFYYTTSTPIVGASATAGFTFVEQRDDTLKRITFKPYNSNTTYVMRYYNEWNDWENPFNNLETVLGAQGKANTAENNAKNYTDEKYAKRHKVLFEGSANGVGTVFNLNETLDNFIMLFVVGDYPGGEFATVLNPLGNRNMNINLDNVVGLDGRDATTYECSIVKDSQTKLRINSDNFVGIISGNGSGEAANRITIQKIVGVYA